MSGATSIGRSPDEAGRAVRRRALGRRSRTGQSLGNARLPRSFVAWAVAATFSDVGGNAMYFALVWAATLHGGTAAGLVVSAITIPRTILLLLGGAVADRTGPRAVMIAGDASLLVITGALAVTALSLGSPLWLLIVGAVAIGTVTAFYLPASSSLPRRLVTDPLVPRAVALHQSGSQFAELSGGPLGSVLAAALGFAAAAGADAMSFVPVLIVMVLSRAARPAVAEKRHSIGHEIARGVKVSVSQPILRIGLLLVVATVAVVVPTGSVLIPLLVRAHGWSALVAGLTLGAESVGGLAVALIVARRGSSRQAGRIASLGLTCSAAGAVLLAVAPSPELTVSAGAAFGAGIALFTTHAFPLILNATPHNYLSRVQSVLSLGQAAVLMVAAPAVGLSAAHLGVTQTLVICAAALVAAAIVGLITPAWRKARQPEGPGVTA